MRQSKIEPRSKPMTNTSACDSVRRAADREMQAYTRAFATVVLPGAILSLAAALIAVSSALA